VKSEIRKRSFELLVAQASRLCLRFWETQPRRLCYGLFKVPHPESNLSGFIASRERWHHSRSAFRATMRCRAKIVAAGVAKTVETMGALRSQSEPAERKNCKDHCQKPVRDFDAPAFSPTEDNGLVSLVTGRNKHDSNINDTGHSPTVGDAPSKAEKTPIVTNAGATVVFIIISRCRPAPIAKLARWIK